MLVHNVYFSLKDGSQQAIGHLVNSCNTSLSSLDGISFFACGTLTPDLDRPVNDRDFDVHLLVAFESRATHDQYQVSQAHLKFLEKHKDSWSKVRIFDSDVES